MVRLSQTKYIVILLTLYITIGMFAPHFDDSISGNFVEEFNEISQPTKDQPNTGAINIALNVINSIPIVGDLLGFVISLVGIIIDVASYPALIMVSDYPVFVKAIVSLIGVATWFMVGYFGINVIKMLPTT